MISLERAVDRETWARIYWLRLFPGERVPYITGRRVSW